MGKITTGVGTIKTGVGREIESDGGAVIQPVSVVVGDKGVERSVLAESKLDGGG